MQLKQYFEKYPKASILKLAHYTGLKYDTLLNQLKKPSEDPSGKNWAQLELKLKSKGFNWDTFDWNALCTIRTSTNTKGRGPHGRFLSTGPSDFNVGDKLYTKDSSKVPYTVIATTETHVVVVFYGETKPYVWSSDSMKVFGVTKQPR